MNESERDRFSQGDVLSLPYVHQHVRRSERTTGWLLSKPDLRRALRQGLRPLQANREAGHPGPELQSGQAHWFELWEGGWGVPAPVNISMTTCQIQTGWSLRSERSFERLNGSIRTKTARNLNIGVSRNRFCDFLADPDSRNFSRFTLMLTGAGTALGSRQLP
jgi:hypothetical protein